MPELSISQPIVDLACTGAVAPSHVRELRRTMYADGSITKAEANELFFLNKSCEEVCPEWVEFFAEAMTDYLVYQMKPYGYVAEDNVKWLFSHLTENGSGHTLAVLEMMVRVVEAALMIPPSLSSHLINTVKHNALKGDGKTRKDLSLTPGAIGAGEVDLLRRSLYAAGGDGNMGITHEEAEALFDLNDATLESENDAAWSDLFVKAIASFLMASHGYQVPSREEALRRERWVEDDSSTFGGMTGEMVAGGFSTMLVDGLRGVWGQMSGNSGLEAAYGEKLARAEAERAVAEQITEVEASWLAERIGRDGILHENEKALLRFIRDESPNVHDALKPLLEKVA
ncbi:MAG: hypothetical protein ACR2OR_09115 [Hyphomicrobiales bacterium]